MAMPSSDGGAMEQGPSCPVLAAWKQSSVVMSQLLKDRLVILQYPTLSRASLADNVDLLAPLITHMGFLD